MNDIALKNKNRNDRLNGGHDKSFVVNNMDNRKYEIKELASSETHDYRL